MTVEAATVGRALPVVGAAPALPQHAFDPGVAVELVAAWAVEGRRIGPADFATGPAASARRAIGMGVALPTNPSPADLASDTVGPRFAPRFRVGRGGRRSGACTGTAEREHEDEATCA